VTEDASWHGLLTALGLRPRTQSRPCSGVASRPPRCAAIGAIWRRAIRFHHRVSAAGQSRLLDCAAEEIKSLPS
jgi:hypothetical protein